MKNLNTNKTTNLFLAATLLLASCGNAKMESKIESKTTEATNSLSTQYNQVPKDELVAESATAQTVLAELNSRYKNSLLTMKQEVEANGAKFALVFLTPECGNSITPTQKKGKVMIESIVKENAIDYYDLTKNIETQDPLVITQMPKDGHLSKAGAKMVATDLLAVVSKYSGHVAPTSDALTSKPSIFGDLNPSTDEILDGGKDLPYRVVTNSQGLRLNNEVTFPKKKQRIVLFGDSVFFCPFLDNNDGIAQQLQEMYPDAEIINTANWGYSVDDYQSLYQEKAKFLEADLVVVQTSGNDIIDFYFSNRLKLSRKKDNIQPSQAELALYTELYAK